MVTKIRDNANAYSTRTVLLHRGVGWSWRSSGIMAWEQHKLVENILTTTTNIWSIQTDHVDWGKDHIYKVYEQWPLLSCGSLHSVYWYHLWCPLLSEYSTIAQVLLECLSATANSTCKQDLGSHYLLVKAVLFIFLPCWGGHLKMSSAWRRDPANTRRA